MSMLRDGSGQPAVPTTLAGTPATVTLFGTGKAEALAYALVSHAWFILTWLVFGILSAISLPFPLRTVLDSSPLLPGTPSADPPTPGKS